MNTAECQYDLGDCSSEQTGATAPTLIWTTGASPDVPDGCIIPDGVPAYWLGKLLDPNNFSSLINVLGDNYCDDVLNTAECQYDLGDCSSSSGSTTSTSQPAVPEGCVVPPLGIPPPPQWLGKV